MANHGAFEPTKMCAEGRMAGSSQSVPSGTQQANARRWIARCVHAAQRDLEDVWMGTKTGRGG
jgi:hypothetical protein